MPHRIDPRLVQPPRPAFTLPDWLPRSILVMSQGYDRQKFVRDAIAGVTVGLVALPLAMAFAIASGLTPQAGIYRPGPSSSWSPALSRHTASTVSSPAR